MVDFHHVTRRGALAGAAGTALLAAYPRLTAAQSGGTQTQPVQTTSGGIRGMRSDGVSIFKGVPYGANTGTARFRPPSAPQAWTGVRDCFAYGAQSYQGRFAFDPPLTSRPPDPTQSEDCLVLNVWTPDASRARKRPVMVWLHGGGFITGNGSSPRYDGSAMCRRGDVVVVTVNHRLTALGYLYLGALHKDFADSGNAGTLDQILALKWVRDNIEAFGGDPKNVTIFGQSGGGMKVGALMAAPAARGLFHKAIMQSGPGYTMVNKDHAMKIAEGTLTNLGVSQKDPHALLKLDPRAINEAMIKAGPLQPGGVLHELFLGLKLSGDIRHDPTGPVADGRTILKHPYYPTALPLSADIPLLLGNTEYESARQLAYDPVFGNDPTLAKMTAEHARELFTLAVGDKGVSAFEIFRGLRPNDAPAYWVSKFATEIGMRAHTVRIAEHKARQRAAPVYLYRADYAFGQYRNPHASDITLFFGHPERAPELVGTGEAPRKASAAMSQSWINFARTGNPSQEGLAWPRFDTSARQTMVFNVESRVVADPDKPGREFAASLPMDSWVEAML